MAPVTNIRNAQEFEEERVINRAKIQNWARIQIAVTDFHSLHVTVDSPRVGNLQPAVKDQ